MTQKDLIQKLKLELGKDFNENASFLVTQPLFKDMTIGLKKDELVNGIYVTLLDKNQAPMLDGDAFYFKVTDPEQYCAKLYSAQWKKYMFPLSKIGDWSTVICGGISYTKVKNEDLVDKPTVFPVPKEVIENLKESVLAQIASVNNFEKMTLEPEKTMKGLFEKPFKEFTEFMEGIVPEDSQKIEELRNMFDKESYSHEEFPIQKIHMQTMYKNDRSETSIIITKPSIEGRMLLFMSDEIALSSEDDYYKFSFTKERFSDLVDLMIEARKDLLK